MHIYIYIYVYTYIHTYIYVCMYVCMYVLYVYIVPVTGCWAADILRPASTSFNMDGDTHLKVVDMSTDSFVKRL